MPSLRGKAERFLDLVDRLLGVDGEVIPPELLFADLREIVHFDGGLFLPIDPCTWSEGRCVAYGTAKRYVDVYGEGHCRTDPLLTRATPLKHFNQIAHFSAIAGEAASEHFRRTPFAHGLGTFCGFNRVPLGLFWLWRSRGDEGFRASECRLIESLALHLSHSLYFRTLVADSEFLAPTGVLVLAGNGSIAFKSESCGLFWDDTDWRLKCDAVESGEPEFSHRLGCYCRFRPIALSSILAAVILPRQGQGEGSAHEDFRAFMVEKLAPRTNLPLRLQRAGLSPREVKVARLAIQGLCYKSIGRRLHVSEQTVKEHMRAIFRKVGSKTRAAFTARILGR